MGIEAEEVAEDQHGNNGARDGIVLRDRLFHENLQGLPSTAIQIDQQLTIIAVAIHDGQRVQFPFPGVILNCNSIDQSSIIFSFSLGNPVMPSSN